MEKEHWFPLVIFVNYVCWIETICKAFSNRLDEFSIRGKQNKTKCEIAEPGEKLSEMYNEENICEQR